jgi:hypothetical protein
MSKRGTPGTFAAFVLLVGSSTWLPFRSTVYPYTMTPPSGFKYVVLLDDSNHKIDYYFPSLGSFVTNINIYAARGQTALDEQAYLHSLGAWHVRRSGWIVIMGRRLPLMRGDFHGLVGRWTVEQVSLAACGMVWRLTISYDVRYAKLRSSMVRALQTFTCSTGSRPRR